MERPSRLSREEGEQKLQERLERHERQREQEKRDISYYQSIILKIQNNEELRISEINFFNTMSESILNKMAKGGESYARWLMEEYNFVINENDIRENIKEVSRMLDIELFKRCGLTEKAYETIMQCGELENKAKENDIRKNMKKLSILFDISCFKICGLTEKDYETIMQCEELVNKAKEDESIASILQAEDKLRYYKDKIGELDVSMSKHRVNGKIEEILRHAEEVKEQINQRVEEKLREDTEKATREVVQQFNKFQKTQASIGATIDQHASAPGNTKMQKIASDEADKAFEGARRKLYEEKKGDFLQENEYAQTMDNLLEYLTGMGLYVGNTRKDFLVQSNYSEFPFEHKEIVFFPYIDEFEKATGELPDNLPKNVREMYENFKKSDDTKKTKVMLRSLIIEQLIGAVDLENPNVHNDITDVNARKRLKDLCENLDLESVIGLLKERIDDKEQSRGTQSSEFRDSMRVDVNIYENASNSQNQGEQRNNPRDSRSNPSDGAR